MARYFKFIIYIGILSLTGCSSSDAEPKQEYIYLTPNSTTEYAVEEKKYSITGGETRRSFYLKETVGEKIQAINGFPVYSLSRYTKPGLTDEWKLDSLWTAYILPDKYVKVENNVSLLKIKLPVRNGSQWNGNELNHWGEVIYSLKTLDDKIEVLHYNDSSAVELNRSKEIYQKGKGMIYKEIINLQFCQSSPDCIGKGVIVSGQSTIYTVQ